MSIYATLWILKFPSTGDYYYGCDWVEVKAQGVPAHIGSPTPGQGYEDGDPYSAFLPPAVETDESGETGHLRAVVIVTEKATKGTPRSPQEYADPLLTLDGREYSRMSFGDLHERICDALRGNGPALAFEIVSPSGRRHLYFEDGTLQEPENAG